MLIKNRKTSLQWDLIVTSIIQIRPDDIFLGEAENSKSSTFQCAIINISRICYHNFTIENFQANQADLRPMNKRPEGYSSLNISNSCTHVFKLILTIYKQLVPSIQHFSGPSKAISLVLLYCQCAKDYSLTFYLAQLHC